MHIGAIAEQVSTSSILVKKVGEKKPGRDPFRDPKKLRGPFRDLRKLRDPFRDLRK